MGILRTADEPLRAALPAIGQRSFPGMSADEVDAFTLGYYAGAMAHALVTREKMNAPDQLADRIEAELERIRLTGGEAT